jgi:septation ring formation regulator EzrA
MKKSNLKELIERAQNVLKNMDQGDPSYSIIDSYTKEAEGILPEIKGTFTSSQQEVYEKLEIAIGP